MTKRLNVYISNRREYEFGMAFGWSHSRNRDNKYIWDTPHIRFSFGKRSLVFVCRKKK